MDATTPVDAIIPGVVNAVGGAAVRNPYTAAAVGAVVAGLAIVTAYETGAPRVRGFRGMFAKAGQTFRKTVNDWSAEPVGEAIRMPNGAAPVGRKPGTNAVAGE